MTDKPNQKLKQITLKIAQPDKIFKEQKVDFIALPACDGDIGIQSGHAPFLSTLRPGKLIITSGDTKEEMDVESGFVEVLDDEITVLLK